MTKPNESVQLSTNLERMAKADKVQSSGRLPAVFPALLQGTAKEEEYIARMIQRDREINWG